MKYLNQKTSIGRGAKPSPQHALRELALMHASVERIVKYLRAALAAEPKDAVIRLLNEASSVTAIGQAQIEFALADTSDLPALNSCIAASGAILRVARRCERHQQLLDLAEALRLIAFSCLQLITALLPDDPKPARPARRPGSAFFSMPAIPALQSA